MFARTRWLMPTVIALAAVGTTHASTWQTGPMQFGTIWYTGDYSQNSTKLDFAHVHRTALDSVARGWAWFDLRQAPPGPVSCSLSFRYDTIMPSLCASVAIDSVGTFITLPSGVNIFYGLLDAKQIASTSLPDTSAQIRLHIDPAQVPIAYGFLMSWLPPAGTQNWGRGAIWTGPNPQLIFYYYP